MVRKVERKLRENEQKEGSQEFPEENNQQPQRTSGYGENWIRRQQRRSTASPGARWEQTPECRAASDQEALKQRNPRRNTEKGRSRNLKEKQNEANVFFLTILGDSRVA